jgi:hypothetical protein
MTNILDQQVIGAFSAVAAGCLAMIPAYQRWREVRREQETADLAAGLPPRPRGEARHQALVATARSWETWVAMALAAVILGVLFNNHLRSRRFVEDWHVAADGLLVRQTKMIEAIDRIEVMLRTLHDRFR